MPRATVRRHTDAAAGSRASAPEPKKLPKAPGHQTQTTPEKRAKTTAMGTVPREGPERVRGRREYREGGPEGEGTRE